MKILILDDMQMRHDVFANFFAGHDVTHTFKFSDFVKALEQNSPFDIIHLDHDLADFFDQPDFLIDNHGRKKEYNGQHAALKVTQLPEELLPLNVIIHSVNPLGAQAMLEIIQNKGIPVVCEPFKAENY